MLLATLLTLACRHETPPGPTRASEAPVSKQVASGKPVTPEEIEAFWGPPLERPRNREWYLWWEAETPSATNYPSDNPFAPANAEEAEVLSEGKWIGTSGVKHPLFLEYEVIVPRAGTFQFRVRKFWKHGPFRWRFDKQDWRHCSGEIKPLDGATLRLHVEANWVFLGDVELAAGSHRLRLDVEANNPSAFDAFVLTQGDFAPRGKLKPDEEYPPASNGWAVFDPPLDDFAATPVDLRRLNQTFSGEDGFVQASDGQFVFEETRATVRFWGMNAGHDLLNLSDRSLKRYARRLAKLGVNLLRLHGPMWRADELRQVDRTKLAGVHKLAAVLAEQGIYLKLSIYFPLWVDLQSKDGFAGYSGQHPFSLPYFSSEFQRIQKNWWRALLLEGNPITGVPLAHDPTLAMIEFINEDSTLFWTFKPYETIPEPQMVELERRFGTWLAARHGSLAKAFEVWKTKPVRGDDLAEGRAGFIGLWNITNQPSARGRDTAEFLARLMHDYYSAMHSFVRNDLGVRALTICSNWHTADERILGPLDNWANATCDVMDRHGYFAGPHTGEGANYSIRAGQQYADRSALRFDPGSSGDTENAEAQPSLPFLEPRVNGKPHIISEVAWSRPNRFRAEGPMLLSSYGALHGVDAIMLFASDDPGWTNISSKFEASDPLTMGQFPAAATIFRTGLVATAEPLARVSLSEQDLFGLRGVPFASAPGLDALRAVEPSRPESASLDQRALLLGPTDFELGVSPSSASSASPPQPSPRANAVTSRTGELTWDSKRGLVTLVAPKATGAVGFWNGDDTVQLPELDIQLTNPYASAWLVSLDGQPLKASRSVLLQVTTEVTRSGWSAPGSRTRTIVSAGRAPVLRAAIQGRVRLPERGPLSLSALDANGMPVRRAHAEAHVVIPLLSDVSSYLIER